MKKQIAMLLVSLLLIATCGCSTSYTSENEHDHSSVPQRTYTHAEYTSQTTKENCYRNDLQGTIVCTSDGKSVLFVTEKNETIQTNPTETVPETDSGIEYIGNKNSKKFHLPTCANLPAEKNRVFFDTRQAAVDASFSPCGNCKP